MSLRLRVLVLGLLFSVVLLAAGVAVLGTLGEETDARMVVRERVQPADDAARSVLAGLVDQETGTRGYVITGDERYLQPYVDGQRRTREALRRIEEIFPGDPEIERALERVRVRADRWREGSPQLEIAARRRGDTREAVSIVASGAGRLRFDRVREAADRLQDIMDERVAAAALRADDNAEDLRLELAVIAILLLLLTLISFALARRWMLAPLRKLQTALRGVAAGDLTRRIEPTGPPETRSLAHDAESMRRRILDELDASEGARQGLEQRGPVVAGLRRQLEASSLDAPAGLATAGVLHPAEGVLAGDFYDVLQLPSGLITLVLVDVSGHGAEAGLVAVRLKHVMTTALRLGLRPGDALAMVAEDFTSARDRFATCVVVEIDPASGRLRWANAGHPPPIVAAPSGIAGELGTTGPLLSSIGGTWSEDERTLRPGDLVLAYTDGLTEARSGGEEFGDQRVRDTVTALGELTPVAAVDACLAAVRAHAREERHDDITIVAVQFVGSELPATAG